MTVGSERNGIKVKEVLVAAFVAVFGVSFERYSWLLVRNIPDENLGVRATGGDERAIRPVHAPADEDIE